MFESAYKFLERPLFSSSRISANGSYFKFLLDSFIKAIIASFESIFSIVANFFFKQLLLSFFYLFISIFFF